jgi:hypothetical protein
VDFPESSGGIPVPKTAEVGQTIKVSAVDDTGKPTAWEAVDFPSGKVEPFRLLRTVVVPEDASADTSGVTWLERSEGGYWFGFDTDADGNPFEVSELIIRYDVACVGAGITYKVNTGVVPSYGRGGISGYNINKAGSWQWVHFLGPFIQYFAGTNNGTDVCNVHANRWLIDTFNNSTNSVSSISTYANNQTNNGLTAGTISFYGR